MTFHEKAGQSKVDLEGGSLEDCPLRFRADSVLVSSVLHTIALLCLIRPAWWNYSVGREEALLADAGFQEAARRSHDLGVACLAIILVGLIVVWTGYVRRSRPAWLVMFVIAWFWAFPLFILPFAGPLIRGRSGFTLPELLYNAILGPGSPRIMVTLTLVFSLMVMGLVLPMGRFFVARKADEPIHVPSRRLVRLSLIGVPVAMLALFLWLSIGVLYEIPNQQLLYNLDWPPPPPPPPKSL